MKIYLEETQLGTISRKVEIERQLAEIEEKLKFPDRTVDDIVRHIQLLKEYKLYE